MLCVSAAVRYIWLCLTFVTDCLLCVLCCFFFQAEDGIRDLVRSRGLGDVYKRQGRAVVLHLFLTQLADDRAGQYRLDKHIALQDQVLSLIQI